MRWSFDGIVRLAKLKSLSLRVGDSRSSSVPDEAVSVVSVVKKLHALMLEHPTLEHLYICCQHDDCDEPSKVFPLQLTNLSLAKYSKVDLHLCTDCHWPDELSYLRKMNTCHFA